MMRSSRSLVIVCGALALALAVSSVATAGVFKRSQEPLPDAATPSAQTALPKCCGEPCITYKTHHLSRKVCCDSCDPPVKAVLHVEKPGCCCTVEVPVCVPDCCEGAPHVDDRCGMFGRGVVTYTWCCGYKIRVVFDRGGDVTVHYYGL